MKIIRNLLRYDTENATKICTLLKTEIVTNPPTLYCTKRGNWFLYTDTTNDFTPLTREEAALKLEQSGKYDLIERHFSDLIKEA